MSLLYSYDVVTTALENIEENQLKLDIVKARLLAEEQKRSGSENGVSVDSEAGFAAKSTKEKIMF